MLCLRATWCTERAVGYPSPPPTCWPRCPLISPPTRPARQNHNTARAAKSRNSHPIAQTAQANERLGAARRRPHPAGAFRQSPALPEPPSIISVAQPIAHAGGNRDDILQRPPEFNPEHIGAGINAEGGPVEQGYGFGAAVARSWLAATMAVGMSRATRRQRSGPTGQRTGPSARSARGCRTWSNPCRIQFPWSH